MSSHTIVEDVVAQYASDAPFLWSHRERAAGAPHHSLRTLAELDERLDAHIDGLRIAGEAGWRLCEAGLDEGRDGELFVAGILAFESGHGERVERVLTAVRSASHVPALAAALGWVRLECVAPLLTRLAGSSDPMLQRLGIAGHAFHRADPGAVLRRAIDHPDVGLRTQALNAAGALGRRDLLPACRQHAGDGDEHCRFNATRSAVRLGERSERLAETLWAFVEGRTEHAEEALRTVMRAFARETGRRLIAGLLVHEACPRLAAVGIGALGDARLLDTLTRLMCIPEVARVAGEAFSMITGVDLPVAGLADDGPAGFRSGPTDDPHDEIVGLDPDEHLPWPAPARIIDWCHEHRGAFQPGRRYLCGQAITRNGALATLADAHQRQREGAALELALHSPERPMFDVRAHSRTQRRWLRAWAQ